MSAGGRGGPPKIAPNCAATGDTATGAKPSAPNAMSSSLCRTMSRPAIRPRAYARTEERLVNTGNTAGKGRATALRPLVLRAWQPRLVVAGRLRAAALRQRRAGRALRGRCAGRIGPVRLLP